MNIRSWLLALSVALVLTACGGGGGSSTPAPTPTPPAVLPPTVNLTIDSTSVVVGAKVKLTWTTTDANSCSASGAWSGVTALSGTSTQTPTTSGTLTYTLTCSGTGGTTNSSASLTSTEIPYFTEVPNAIPDNSAIYAAYNNNISLFIITPIDINHDGKKDLVASYWKPIGVFDTTLPCPNVLVIYIQQADGTFKDETATYLGGTPNLGGCSRDVKVADVNGDGYPDIVYSMAQEDGRNSTTASNIFAKNVVLLSNQNGGYSLSPIGHDNWWNAIGVGYDSNNKAFIGAGGYYSSQTISGSEVVQNANSQWINIQDGFPSFGPDFLIFTNENDSKSQSKYIFLNQGSGIDLKLYSLSANGWSLSSKIQHPIVLTVQSTNWTSPPGTTSPLWFVNLDGALISGSFIQSSCSFKFNSNSNPVHILNYAGSFLPNNYIVGDILNQDSLTLYHHLTGWSITNGVLSQVQLNIDKEDTTSNVNFLQCEDVNNDGYTDIVLYPYSSLGKPIVYLNNHNGGFKAVDSAIFPSAPQEWQTGGKYTGNTVLYEDLNGDGIPDLLLWNTFGNLGGTPGILRPRLYIGKKFID